MLIDCCCTATNKLMMFRIVYLLIALFERFIGCLRLSKFQLNIKHVYAHTKGAHSWTNW